VYEKEIEFCKIKKGSGGLGILSFSNRVLCLACVRPRVLLPALKQQHNKNVLSQKERKRKKRGRGRGKGRSLFNSIAFISIQNLSFIHYSTDIYCMPAMCQAHTCAKNTLVNITKYFPLWNLMLIREKENIQINRKV
jgi:hypothetical protein